MKKIICLLSLVVFMGCSQPKSNSESSSISDERITSITKSNESLQKIIDANINKQPRIDTIAFGFSFEMTKPQSIAHYIDLRKQKKIVINEKNNRYEYPMSFELVNVLAAIAPEFQDNKLYKLSLVIEPADDMGTEETVFLQAVVTYMKKYKGYTLFQEPDLTDEKEKKFHWIKNNLHIVLQKCPGGAIVSYINMPVEREINKKKSAEKDSSKAATNKDI